MSGVWPGSAFTRRDGELLVGGVGLRDLAERFGTPLHALDEEEVRRRCQAFRRAFPGADVAYAGKAFLCRAMAGWVAEEGLALDVCSAGELAVARAAGFPAGRILLHGNAKTPEDLHDALEYGVGRIVVDSFHEICRLATLRPASRLLVRVTPGVDGHTHAAMNTGVDGQKFGFPLSTGAAAEAVRRVLAQPGLTLGGLHCHLGSQITGAAAYEEAVRRMVALLAAVREEHGVTLDELDLGGGFGVAYRPGEPELDPETAGEAIGKTLRAACAEHRTPVPRLTIEPGRAIVARAGVTVYRVLGVKRGLVAVDGGMSDNPRPGLYGARYTARLVGRRTTCAEREVTVVGRHCEAGDVLARDVPLPADVRPGDLLAVPVTGAYHHAMASNYNLVRRPPVVGVGFGRARLLVRRETPEDLLLRDVG
ncbi:diaminopimelate decarboxylase [Actinomadura gamaensis]|uniref:Diaminopimelate decarboxylase n=1 Tax=Actinomadura gamaensis TaxID=1763541 RepID=A0ABV9U883_9ACTN